MGSFPPPPKVAIIGAGISGVVTAAHLMKRGIEVTVFERNAEAGGVWVFDERIPPEPFYPAITPSKGEQFPLLNKSADEEITSLFPPGPAYRGLQNNIRTELMKTSFCDWPLGTTSFVNHKFMKEYIQDVARRGDVESQIHYNISVQTVEKIGSEWRVETKSRRKDSVLGDYSGSKTSYTFDSVVVAAGHYHAPRVPDLPGLRHLKTAYPSRVMHAKGYRGPEPWTGKTVLTIGAGASGLDITKELLTVASKVFHSSRQGQFDVPASMFPEETVEIGEVEAFELDESDSVAAVRKLDDSSPLPITVHLKSGEHIRGIDHIILCTGYHMTLPFLNHLHQDNVLAAEADEHVLVTDGTQMHNLHKDIFYIPDPSLIFVGVPFYTVTFMLFEYQAMVVAAFLAGKVSLPSLEGMRKEYDQKLEKKGAGKQFNSLRGKDVEYVNELLAWANLQLVEKGDPELLGPTKEWLDLRDQTFQQRLRASSSQKVEIISS